jgi:hypothetical protein
MKIWRYLDLAKFVHMISSRALYFACPCEFEDPYESYLPLSYIKAHEKTIQETLGSFHALREQFAIEFPDKDTVAAAFDSIIEQARAKLDVRQMMKNAGLTIGVNCWHRNESQSAAMWQLYGNCIALESSRDQLQRAMATSGFSASGFPNVIIYDVQYVDFHRDPIERGHQHYMGFLKRTAFQHEQELRATVLLKERQGAASTV